MFARPIVASCMVALVLALAPAAGDAPDNVAAAPDSAPAASTAPAPSLGPLPAKPSAGPLAQEPLPDDGAIIPPATRSSVEVPRAERPNIVVFHVDDVAPHDGRLWSDPLVTPNLRELFVESGTSFPRSIGETPACCPGRGALLTGLHTHNHGVTHNNVLLFKPAEHIGHAMGRAGYETMWLGKYFNRAQQLSDTQWSRHAAGWSQLDVFRSRPGFLDYTLYTKQGSVAYNGYHMLRMVGDRLISHSRAVSPSKPIFAVLSVFNLHSPNVPVAPIPAAVLERCAQMAPWKPPGYNEQDVSDKPAHIQALPLLPHSDGWPMDGYCREMYGVDQLVGRVREELAAQDRLDNTLFVFTADNGMAWGQHRIGQDKFEPYATPVPLVFWWPERWGPAPRVVDELVSNIDLAPTLCDIAGCSLGPFPSGQPGPDGVSLLPLLDGSQTRLQRDALLESNWEHQRWTAVRTTPSHPLGEWHYIERADGFRELYDLNEDPWELDNRAADPTLAPIVAALADRLASLRLEGVWRAGSGSARPDVAVSASLTGRYRGVGYFAAVAAAEQTARRNGVRRNASYSYYMRIRNVGGAQGDFAISVESTGSPAIRTRYLIEGWDVTALATGGQLVLRDVPPSGAMTLAVKMVLRRAPIGAERRALIRVSNLASSTLVDVGTIVIRR